jgi:hypothetical protein
LRIFLPQLEHPKMDEWLDAALALNEMPNARESVAMMNSRVRLHGSTVLASPAPENVAAALSKHSDTIGLRPFVIRTFMYLSYAELAKLPFAPDSTRSNLVDAALRREGDLASELRSRLAQQWQHFPAQGDVDLRRRVSPFAAVVLERCKGSRKAIPWEILTLRDELRSVRESLGELEHAILFGIRQKAVKAEAKWNGVLKEVGRSYGPSPDLVNLASGLALAQSAADVLDKPTSVSAWAGAIAALPVTAAARYFRRRPVAQLYKLRSELPASGRLSAVVNAMFPEITRSRQPLAALHPVRRPE